MQLKSLEIKGFKSFVEKTQIHFDSTITGVVGPNGCGKSNIVDAIRWVLGEQKPTLLRLEKMEDVIFNGTKERSPANIAEVSLTLDNTRNILPTEFTTITITRSLTRDGDSDYKLNGVSCRLKDIRNLFMDTGISNDTYAIIELKMIDEILNDVDKARRRLIEQSAGVSKFKTRKRETLSKLAGTEADLNRVDDLLFEIEKNLKALESQARKAKQFKKIREEYKELSVALAKFDLATIQEQYDKLQENIKAEEDKHLSVHTAIQQMEADLQKEKKRIIDRERSLSEQQKAVNTLLEAVREKESNKKLAEQQSRLLEERISVLAVQIDQAEAAIKTLEEEIAVSGTDNAAAVAELSTRKAALDEGKAAVDRRRETNLALRDAAEKERQGFQGHRNRIVELEKQFAAKESGREQLEKSIQRSLFEKEERMQSLTTLQDELSTYQGKIDTQRALVDDLVAKEEKNSETISTLEESIRTAEQELANMNRQLDAKNNELKLTKNMIDNLEGFPESIKFLRKEAGWLRDAPLVSDILYCEEKYRVVVEQLLQPYLNNYIVENEAFAYNALELLGKSSKGKASFFVLEYFEKEKEKTPLKIPGITPAFGVIEAEEKYRSLLSHLLDGFYIADDQVAMDKAIKSGKLKGDFVLATPAGDLLRSNVQLSGGAVGLFEGKRVGRLKSLEKLDKEVKSLEEHTQHARRKVQQDRQELQQLKTGSLRNVIERERQALQQLEKDLVSRQARIENFRDIVSRSDEYSRNTQVSLDALNTDLEKIDRELQELRTEAEGRQQQADKAEEAYRKAAELFAIEQDSWNKQHIAYIQEENLLQSKRQALGFKQRQLEDTRINLDKYNTEKDHAAKEIQRLQAQAVALGAELENEYAERDNLMTTLSSSENEYYQQKERITALEDQLRDRNSIIRQGEQQVTAYKDQMNDLKLRLNILKERFHIEFRIDIETIIDDLQLPDMSKQEVEDKLQRIRQRIDAFGEVNPMAEEAYAEMKERYDFISGQKNDLVEAKQDLLDTIKEIEETAREQFMETFTSVRENFIKVFRSMFNPEDSCDLVLEDANDPLESDIDIIAKPKGKRPQSVSQLSGGEKTLTALSLLFALYLHKPAPFCILDEVDAPLDDNNIKKFNDAIRQFSDNSQFILVTHNKQTMASVDVIYGVTMVQKGMSRVVPVDFRSLN